MQLKVYLFEDLALKHALQPLTQHRLVAELWAGTSTLERKWPARVLNADQADILVMSGVVPTPSTFQLLNQLPADSSYVYEGQVLAQRGQGANHLEQYLPFLQHPEDLLAYQAEFLRDEIKGNNPVPGNNTYIQPKDIYIHHSARVQGSILDASKGPIYIGEDVNIQIGTLIQGPAALLEGATTNIGAKIRPNTTIGPGCKVGGEINHCIFFPFSNKAHEGYLGNSIVGSFSNLGALTNGSNLRNDIQTVSLYDYTLKGPRNTSLKSLGQIIGDYVTTGVGTNLNTGTVIGSHCNLSSIGFPPRYIPSFSFGEYPALSAFDFEKAFASACAWMQLKNQEIPENLRQSMEEIWKADTSFRN
jgi:UDP-N-acetylglucosamine diphosphorylase / glucose-1-phosphate thymidylyltransferase / UDP-N-acetylgalactosamine diphosphorylase / glucosamine-1-phosphate N-acetyltransferase / galactosamine-1-phosphate N-acetyltransferase